MTQTVTASVNTQYNPAGDTNAVQLSYTISTDNNNILSYSTDIDWDTDATPAITEDTNELDVVWDLSSDVVPKGTWVTIDAEVVVPYDANGCSASIGQINWKGEDLGLTAVPGSLMWGRHSELELITHTGVGSRMRRVKEESPAEPASVGTAGPPGGEHVQGQRHHDDPCRCRQRGRHG